MAKSDPHKMLAQTIVDLRSKRQMHLDAIASIDQVFVDCGITVEAVKRGPGRPSKSSYSSLLSRKGSLSTMLAGGKAASGARGKRRKFATTGEEAVLVFLQKKGKAGATDVNKYWRSQGRGGKADNALSKLTKEGKLKRVKTKGHRGSLYQVV